MWVINLIFASETQQKKMSESKPYIVSARKYRPSNFKSVVGQKALTNTLKNAIAGNRLAQAYLFCGPRGVGKTSCARIFAKTINCQSPTPDGEACGVCESCAAIEKGNSFNLVELDAASNNSVDDIRTITEQVNVPPQDGKYRIFIIDEVHMLSNSAFNAFLKTLEEPPKNVIFILATTEKHKVIPTILSRCQTYDFKRITIDDTIDHLEYVAKEEGITTDREALALIALKADGAMRDALSIFDQVAASTHGEVTYKNTIENLNVLDHDVYFKLTDAFRNSDVPTTLLIYKDVRDKGFDSLFFINGLAEHIRNLMVAADARTFPLLEVSDEMKTRYHEQAKSLPLEWYYEGIKILNDCDYKYRTTSSKRLSVELALIRLCQLLKPSGVPFAEGDQQEPPADIATPRAAQTATQSSGTSPSMPSTPSPAPPSNPPSGTVHSHPASTASSASEPVRKPNPRSGSGRPSSFRISSQPSNAAPSQATIEKRNSTFTDSQLADAWQKFISENPSLHILVNAMRASTPRRGDNYEYHIEVDHPAQKQAFETSMMKLLEYLRNSLSNDFLQLKVTLNEENSVEKMLPPREFLRKVAETNPGLAQFLKNIDAELV